MKKMKNVVIVMLVTLLIPFVSAWAEELPRWVTEWQNFAQQSGDRLFVEFADRLSDPSGVELGKNWAEYQGFDAPSYVEKHDPAPEIKPGLVITNKNYKNYPGLEKLMAPGMYELMEPGAFAGLRTMTIVPTIHYYPSAGRQKYTEKYEGTCKIEDGFNLANWKAAYPFPKIDPKDPLAGVKLMHNLDVGATGMDDWEDNPISYFLFGRDNKLERTHVCRLLWKYFKGRTDNEPIHGLAGTKYREKGVMIAKSPYDIAGFIGIKSRESDMTKPDDFITYVPSMRRIRRLSGSNPQDPLIGSDFTWDDWRGFWNKLSNKAYDLKAEYVGEEIRLMPARVFPVEWEGSYMNMYWEKRPFYVVDFHIGGEYTYARQRIWIDKELFYVAYKKIYDRKGRLWKKMYTVQCWWPESGLYDWTAAAMIDVLNRHWTGMHYSPVPHADALPDNLFDLNFILRRAN